MHIIHVCSTKVQGSTAFFGYRSWQYAHTYDTCSMGPCQAVDEWVIFVLCFWPEIYIPGTSKYIKQVWRTKIEKKHSVTGLATVHRTRVVLHTTSPQNGVIIIIRCFPNSGRCAWTSLNILCCDRQTCSGVPQQRNILGIVGQAAHLASPCAKGKCKCVSGLLALYGPGVLF